MDLINVLEIIAIGALGAAINAVDPDMGEALCERLGGVYAAETIEPDPGYRGPCYVSRPAWEWRVASPPAR